MLNIDKILEPYRKIQKSLDSYQNLTDATNAAQALQERWQKPLTQIRKSLEIISNQKKLIANVISPKYFEGVQEIGKRISENLKKTPESLMLLSKYGWYLNFESEFNFPNKLGNLLKQDKVVEVDEILVQYYTENLGRILVDLQKRYPDRKEIFSQIISAHKERKYYLTIPCILSQVDGICYDTTTKKYFITEKKDKHFKHLPEVATEFVNISGSISEAFSMPILNQTAVNSHESRIDKFPIKLNRHLIMHGVDKEFGTEKNSVKCISLLVYLSDMLTLVEEQKN